MAENSRRKIQEVIGLMQKNLECSICLEMMNNPVSTSCGHQFCRFCLMEFLERKKQVPCPLCKKMITKRSLMDRSQLGQMVDNVRSLVAAFQTDTGMLFSPPRGPQSLDLPCTPEPIHAKIVTERNGRSTSASEKKMGKRRNTRISRRKTLDNAEIGFNTAEEQSSSTAISDRRRTDLGNRIQVVGNDDIEGQDSLQNGRFVLPTEKANTELLDYIENGDHCRKNPKTNQIVIKRLKDKKCRKSKLNTTVEKSDEASLTDKNDPNIIVSKISKSDEYTFLENSDERTPDPRLLDSDPKNHLKQVSEIPEMLTVSETKISERNDMKNEDILDSVVHLNKSAIEGETDLLFQSPVTFQPICKSRKLSSDNTERSDFDTKELRSRKRKSPQVCVEKGDSLPCEELTPDTPSETGVLHLPQNKQCSELRTYSKRGLTKLDKNTKLKVTEWLESVAGKGETKDAKSDEGEMKGKKVRVSKKELQLKEEEEKMGQKMKRLAEQMNFETVDSCFGFEENGSQFNQTQETSLDVNGEKVAEKKNESIHSEEQLNDLKRDQDNCVDSTNFEGYIDYCKESTDLEKGNTESVANELEKVETSRLEHARQEMLKKENPNIQGHQDVRKNNSVENPLLNKRRIFRTRLLNQENASVASKNQTLLDSKKTGSSEGKGKDEVIELESLKKKHTLSCPGTENRFVADQSLQDSDPYEFKSSQNTPKKTKNKKVKNVKPSSKKKSKEKQNFEKDGKYLSTQNTAQSNKKAKAQDGVIDDVPVPCTQEEIRKMSNKLNQAEDYDLLFCTQEAVDSINKQDHSVNSDTYIAYPINSELLGTFDTDNVNSKGSQQKKVRFRDPVISDFIYEGKIDILGFRKAKEKMKNLGENKSIDNVSVDEGDMKAQDDVQGTVNTESDADQTCGNGETKRSDMVSSACLENEALVKTAINPDKVGGNKKAENEIDDCCARSPERVFKNPMMTPTIHKKSPCVPVGNQTETLDDEMNSSGTDDLDINPDQDEFEEPDIEIQPEDIKEKLTSQELFVRNVLSTPQASAMSRPSPQSIAETPVDFALPSLNTTEQGRSRSSIKNHIESEILMVTETPLIDADGSLSLSLKDSCPEFCKETPLCNEEDKEEILQTLSENLLEGKIEPSSKESNSKLQIESDETLPPSPSAVVLSNIEKQTISALDNALPKSSSNSLENELIDDHEKSVENSISLLDQPSLESKLALQENFSTEGNTQIKNNIINDENMRNEKTGTELAEAKLKNISSKSNITLEYSEADKVPPAHQRLQENEFIPKMKKKRKSFMLDGEDNPTTLSVVSPGQDSPSQQLKRKRLSRSPAPKTQNSTSQQKDMSGVETYTGVTDTEKKDYIQVMDGAESSFHVESSLSKSDSILENDRPNLNSPIDKNVPASEAQDISNVNAILATSRTVHTIQGNEIGQSLVSEHVESQCGAAESCELRKSDVEKIDVSESVQSDLSTLDPQNIDDEREAYLNCIESDSRISKKAGQIDGINMVPETEIIDSNHSVNTQESQRSMEMKLNTSEMKTCHNAGSVTETELKINKRKSKQKAKHGKNSKFEGNKDKITNGEKQRPLSGILVSPEENILATCSKDSPEDIFDMHSEMPFVNNSPFEETIMPVYLSEEETVTSSMNIAKENRMESVENESYSNTLSKDGPDGLKNIASVAEVRRDHPTGDTESTNHVRGEVKHIKQVSDSESDYSQQERCKKRRRSGIKGARGFAARNKQSGSSNSNSDLPSPISAKSRTGMNSSLKIDHVIDLSKSNKVGSNTPMQKIHDEQKVADLSDSNKYKIERRNNICLEHPGHINDRNDENENYVALNEVEDLPDLNQKVPDKSVLQGENVQNASGSKIRIACSAISDNDESEINEQTSVHQSNSAKQHENIDVIDFPATDELSQNSAGKTAGEKGCDDTSSSEFELSSTVEEHSQIKINEHAEIDSCIRNAKESIIDLENTFSEIMKTNSDNESHKSSQENKEQFIITDDRQNRKSVKNLVKKNKRNAFCVREKTAEQGSEQTVKPHTHAEVDKNYQLKKMDIEESVEVLESDVDLCDSDSDDVPVTKKKSRKAVIADSSSEDEDDSHHMNLTSSSAFSSQSETLTTQDRLALEKDLERMAKEMEALKAQLRKGHGHAKDTSKSNILSTSLPEKTQQDVVTVDDDTDLDELIEMDDSGNEYSGHDLFMSPPPLSFSQNETNYDVEKTGEVDSRQDGAPGQITTDNNQIDQSKSKSRPPLADLDVNRPVSPGRKMPKAFIATGLTLHQVQEVKKLASLNDCKFYNKFNESVTHVIVKPAKESEQLCDRTLKLFQGIANKCWIVNYYWALDSRHAGHLLPEGPYEILGDTANGEEHQGPRKSRLSQTKLFEKFTFMCVGDCPGLSVDDMAALIQTCGGEVVPGIDSLRQGEKTPLIVTCSDVEDDDGDVQLSSQDVSAINKLYKSHGVVTVSREWVLDSLTLYQLQPLKEYVVTSVKNMVIPRIIES